MNLKLLQELISNYKKHLLSSEDETWLQPYQAMQTWQYHWDMEHLDFKQVYEDSMPGVSPLWEDDDFHPKEMMLKYIEMNSDLSRSAFVDLFDQKRDVVGRTHRFIFILNELKNSYQSKNIEFDTHYHDDRKMIMFYLTMRYPEVQTLYEKEGFEKLLKYVKAVDIKKSHDIGRYAKVAKTINIFIQRDTELTEFVATKTAEDHYYSDANLLLVSGLFKFVALTM